MIKSEKCPYLVPMADNPKNENVVKSYEKGDRWRPWCISAQDWCTFEFNYNECIVYQKAGE